MLKMNESTRENPSKAICECGNEVLLTLHNDGLEGVCECKKTYFIKINEGVWNCCSKSVNTPIEVEKMDMVSKKTCLEWMEESIRLKEQLNRIKVLVIECDADNRAPLPYEILDIISE